MQDVIDNVNEVADQAPANTTYVIHVGTNDVQRIRSEELLDKYLVPRRHAGNRFYSIATSINRRLANLCREESIGYINTWDHFYYDSSLYASDGLHLNQVGAARFGRLLDGAVRDFRAKNGNVLAHQARAE